LKFLLAVAVHKLLPLYIPLLLHIKQSFDFLLLGVHHSIESPLLTAHHNSTLLGASVTVCIW